MVNEIDPNEWGSVRTDHHCKSVPLPGHQRAVSYVRFLEGGDGLVSASTDNSVRLWDIGGTTAGEGGGTSVGDMSAVPEPRLSLAFTGHQNERNFVGLSTSPSGFIACGSENNRVYCYHKVWMGDI